MFKGLFVLIPLVLLVGCGSGGSSSSDDDVAPDVVNQRSLYEGSWQSECFHLQSSGYIVDVDISGIIQSELDGTFLEIMQEGQIWVRETLTISNDSLRHKWELFDEDTCHLPSVLMPVLLLFFNGGDWVDPIVQQDTFTTSEGFEFELYETKNSILRFESLLDKNIHLGYYHSNDQLYMVNNSQETIFGAFEGSEYQVDFNTVYTRQ